MAPAETGAETRSETKQQEEVVRRKGAMILSKLAEARANLLLGQEEEVALATEKKSLQNRIKKLKDKRKVLEKKGVNAMDERIVGLSEAEYKLRREKEGLTTKAEANQKSNAELEQEIKELDEERFAAYEELGKELRRKYREWFMEAAGDRVTQKFLAFEMKELIVGSKKEFGIED
jgi:uncharacterized protein (DUF3084 family)